MTDLRKQQIRQAIEAESIRLGSQNKVANKCGVSPATISQIRNDKWELISNEMWNSIAKSLSVNIPTEWQIIETINFRYVFKTLSDAKNASLFIPISHKAGSGKTTALTAFAELYGSQNVYYIQAREWARREFLLELSKILGFRQEKGYVSVDKLGQQVIDYFVAKNGKFPLLIVDEADKLKPSALRWFITLYNEMEDKMGCVISGTDNLEKTIKQGVRYNRLGFDEIDDRFGRKFIHLFGATKMDFTNVCEANGLEVSDKKYINELFKECEPVWVKYDDRDVQVIDSFRRIKRVIKRELLSKQSEIE